MSAPSTASDLCTRCGLCCNGALFDFGPLAPDEVDAARRDGLTVLASEGQFGFGLPCPALCGATCQTYATRPQTCRAYRCKLLRNLEDEDITPSEAAVVIERTVAAFDAAIQHLPPGATLTDARRWRRQAGEADGATTLNASPYLMMALGMLDLLLDRHFRKASERQIMPRT